MNLDFSEDGNVKVSMIPYLNEILNDFPELLGVIATYFPCHRLTMVAAMAIADNASGCAAWY